MAFAGTNEFDSDSDNHNTYSPLAVRPYDYQFLCNPAFTEAVFVKSASDAFSATVRRLEAGIVAGAMDLDVNKPLERSASHHSTASVRSQRSQRSQTVRNKPRKYASYMSSSASSIASSDKSLTSFPSFSPESPRDERVFSLPTTDGTANPPSLSAPSIKSLTTSPLLPQDRSALFDDDPLSVTNVPGALHHANDEHIERLIARKGAVALVRQYAQDLAHRDAQIAVLRRKAENRERALRKIVLECGLSNLDLETRLRVIEAGTKPADDSNKDELARESGLEDLMNDAMTDSPMGSLDCVDHDQTIRVKDILRGVEPAEPAKEVQKGWKDYIWGSTSRKTSRASSVNGDAISAASASGRGSISRPSVLQNGIFQSPQETIRSPSRASSMLSGNIARDRKPSSGLALWATKLVAGNANSTREFESGNRGRSNSTGETAAHRTHSTASVKTTMSARTVPVNSSGKVIPPSRRTTVATNSSTVRGPPQDRWDTMGTSPPSNSAVGLDNYGPVEMDTILEPDAQPPTMTQIYNNAYNPEFLTDRFGFIYDQRRKKRAKEAAEQVRKNKRGSRVEMLSHARGSSVVLDEGISGEDSRPNTPLSTDERSEDGKPGKRWQDYLKTATFTTELLSHTPAGSVPAFEIMEGGEVPRSPGIITEERGFLPSSASAIAAPSVPVTSENATISKPDTTPPQTAALTKEDAEPVKLLLEQLQEVHDSLQKDKTVKWNDFLRKVRAERKREGEAAAAAFAAETRTQRPMAVMPEVSLADGEMIGIAGLGNKGKVGRAKWNEFKNLVLGGIPVAYRAKIWAECSGAIALRIPGYYDDLVGRKEEDDDPIIISQIRLDINRTLTDNIFFRKGQGVNKLTEVLVAYSRRNPEVGYCQGMNLITAYLLLIMQTAEDAFWVLTSIIENILPRGYYDHSLSASKADQQVLRQYVTSILPKLSSHLDDLSIDLDTLTFQWFLSVFTDCLSAEALFRVWDVVLCVNDGSTFLFQVALALLKLNEQQLLQCSTPAAVYTYLNHQMTNHAISIDGLIHASEGLRKVVRRDEVENRRAKAIETERDLVRQRELKNAERKAQRIAAAAAANGNQTPPEVIVSKPSTPNAEEGDAFEELTVRTPVPVEEERELGAEG